MCTCENDGNFIYYNPFGNKFYFQRQTEKLQQAPWIFNTAGSFWIWATYYLFCCRSKLFSLIISKHILVSSDITIQKIVFISWWWDEKKYSCLATNRAPLYAFPIQPNPNKFSSFLSNIDLLCTAQGLQFKETQLKAVKHKLAPSAVGQLVTGMKASGEQKMLCFDVCSCTTVRALFICMFEGRLVYRRNQFFLAPVLPETSLHWNLEVIIKRYWERKKTSRGRNEAVKHSGTSDYRRNVHTLFQVLSLVKMGHFNFQIHWFDRRLHQNKESRRCVSTIYIYCLCANKWLYASSIAFPLDNIYICISM